MSNLGIHDQPDGAVIGVPDDTSCEAVKAVRVPRPGYTVDPDSVIVWAGAHIAELPCKPTGTILRRALRAPCWAGQEAGGLTGWA